MESTNETTVVPEKELSLEQKTYLHFEYNLGRFLDKIHNYSGSKKQIQRAWKNAAISPLNKEKLHFSYPEEKELFDLYTEVNSTKLIMMLYGLEKDGKIIIKQEFTDVLTGLEKKETVKEEQNG